MTRIIFAFLLVFGTACAARAQKDPLFFQQSAHRILVNPATTGKGGDVNTALTLRQQWVGFQGPTTTAMYTNCFVRGIRSGFGLRWINDKFGPQQTNNIKFNYAYFIPFEEIAFLSFGIGMGVMNNTYSELGFFARDFDDLVLMDAAKQSKTIPDFDFGFEFNTQNIEIGMAVSHITYMYPDQTLVRPMRNFYVYSRYKLPMDRYWDFVPGFTWHNTRKMNTLELNAAFRYNNNLLLNVVYRNPLSCGIAVGVNLSNGFRVSYSYDYGIDNLSAYNSGSHEIGLLHNVPVNTTYIRTILRFFRWKMW